MSVRAQKAQNSKVIRDLLQEILTQNVPDISDADFVRIFGVRIPAEERANMTFAKLLVSQLVTKACSGDNKSISEVLDRLVGKPTQTSENTNINANVNYLTFLDDVASKEKTLSSDDNIVDVEVKPKDDTDEELRKLGLIE